MTQSIDMYKTGDLAGAFIFAGVWIDQLLANATLAAAWDLPGYFEAHLYGSLGRAWVKVTDGAGAPVANATVKAFFAPPGETGGRLTAVTRKWTNASGIAAFGGLAGRYSVEVEAPGFTSVTVPASIAAQAVTGFSASLTPSTD